MRAAIIGFGSMGRRHYTAYQQLGVEVTAICEWAPERVRQALPEFPADRIFTDVGSLLLAVRHLDVVSVTTNGPTHAATTISCAEAGVPNILCEKPMATNLLDARRMVQVCRTRGVRLAINHIRRFSPNHRRLRGLLATGALGHVRHLYLHHGSSGLGNNAVHFFDTFRMYSGSDSAWAIGYLDHTGTPSPRGAQFVDPGGYGLIVFRNGVRAFVDMSEDTGVLPVFVIVGEYGRVVIDEFSDDWQIYARRPEDRGAPLTRYVLPMPRLEFTLETSFDIVDLTRRALDELLSGGPLSCPGEEGVHSLEMVLAFHAADRRPDHRVEFPLAGEALELDVAFA